MDETNLNSTSNPPLFPNNNQGNPGTSQTDPSLPLAATTIVDTNLSSAGPVDTGNKSKFKFFNKKVAIILIVFLLVVAGSVYGAYFFLGLKVTYYNYLPDDTQFYLSLSVRKHPQVQKIKDLSNKLPGGRRLRKELDKYRQELLGTRKDPFKNILDLAETEIFLAKISPDDSNTQGGFGAFNTLEKLVNIAEFKNKDEAVSKFKGVGDDENVTTSQESYASAKVSKFELKNQNPHETSQTFNTGPIPYQVTLPLSKSIFATQLNKYIVAAEKESDVKKILDLMNGSKSKKLKNIKSDKDHNEIVKYFPEETLLKFYQRQVLDPFSNITPGTSLPQRFFLGQTYDTRDRDAEGDSVFTTKRGLTIVAQENGVDFNSYQITKNSRISQGLKYGFTVENSLANRLPTVFNSNQPFFYGETRNVKGLVQDQIDQLDDVAKNSSDDNQGEAFEAAKKSAIDLKTSAGDMFGLDIDNDLLSWMDSNSAMVVAPGFGGKAPELLFIFHVNDPSLVQEKLSKIRLKDYLGRLNDRRAKQTRDYTRESDILSISYALQSYYAKAGKNFSSGIYPPNLQTLISSGDLRTIPAGPNNEGYSYLVCANSQEAAVFVKLEEVDYYWAWNSITGISGYVSTLPANCNFTIEPSYPKKRGEVGRIDPTIENYKDKKIYSYSLYDLSGDKFSLRFVVAGDLVVFSISTSDQTLREIVDFDRTGSNTLAKEPDWQEQFARAPKNIGAISYVVPENLMGIIDYFLFKNPAYKTYARDDWMTIVRGYLKALKSIGSTITQEGSVAISNTFLNIEELADEENKKVEEALDKVFGEKSSIIPSRQFEQANNTQRSSNANSILNAVHQYAADNKGLIPTGIDTTARTITNSRAINTVDICQALVPIYLADLPLDPTIGTENPAASVCTDPGASYNTGYAISSSSIENRLTVEALGAELGQRIAVTR